MEFLRFLQEKSSIKKNFIEKSSLSSVEKFLKETKGNIFPELKYSFFEQIVIFQRVIRKAIILIKQFVS